MAIECKTVKKENVSIVLDFMKDYYNFEGIEFERDKSKNAIENLISEKSSGGL